MNNSVKTRSGVITIAGRVIDRIDRLVYTRLIVPTVGLLPAPVAYGVALLRADLRYTMERNIPKEMVRCLKLVFGDQLSQEECNRVVRDHYRMESCEKVDVMRLLGDGRALLKLVEIRGLEHLKAALAGGKGAILCSGHLGSTSSCYSVIGALGFPVTLVARWSYDRHDRPRLKKLFYRLDNDIPVTCHLRQPNIKRGSNILAALQAASVVRRNEVLGLLIDAGVLKGDTSSPISVDFLNRKATLSPGAVTIAENTGAPLLVMVMHRSTDWRHQVLEISPVQADADIMSTFRQCLATIETAIRRYPALWKKWSLSELAAYGLVQPETIGLRREELGKGVIALEKAQYQALRTNDRK